MRAADQLQQDWQSFVEGLIEEISDLSRLAYDKNVIRQKLKRHYTEDQIELGFREFKSRGAHHSALRSERYASRFSWYQPARVSGSRWEQLRGVLAQKGWSEEHINALDAESSRVVSHLAAPRGEAALVKGLVLGYVQSGKTANFSASIAKATDEGYKLVIVLSGVHNNLRSQTERRLRSELTDPAQGARSFTLTRSSPDGDFNAEPTVTANAVLTNTGKFALAVLKKNPGVLRKFCAWLKQASPDVLSTSPVLIIDDEADQASVNDSRERDRQSAVNSCIREILEWLKASHAVVSYVGYTATPFANILMDAGEASDLFPRDFIVALKPADAYIGAERVFGRGPVDGDSGETGLDLVRYLGPQDVIQSDSSELSAGLRPAMKKALLSFVLAAGERLRRGQRDKHITMLFNTSHLKARHAEVCERVGRFLHRIQISLSEGEVKTLEAMRQLWETDFLRTTQRDFEGQAIGSFNEIAPFVQEFLSELQVIKENSESESRLNFEDGRIWAVVVGGNTLSRGLTIEGLTTSYFHRTTNGYDTLLQMGRWFGYRSGYIDLTRIFVTRNMASNFYHLATVEQELRDDIAALEASGHKPVDIALRIRDHERLNVTNKKVLRRNAQFASTSYSGAKIQATHLFLDDSAKAQRNFRQVQSLVSKLEAHGRRVSCGYQEFKRCLLYKNAASEWILDFLKGYEFSPADRKFDFGLLHPYISELNDRGELNRWSVAVYSTNTADPLRQVDLQVSNLSVYGVERRQSRALSVNVAQLGTVIKGITTLKDEFIDLGSGGSLKDFLGTEQSMLSLRQQRPPEQGLLLIYPLYTHYHLSLGEREKMAEGLRSYPIVSDIKELFGITLVFPPSRVPSFQFAYVQNSTLPRGL